jgi:hypothetical protein
MGQTGIPVMDQQQGGSTSGSPVDDATYNLIAALHSKLEGLEVYEKYSKDDDTGIFQRLIAEDHRHADELLQALRQRLGGTTGG